jgi:hypothetical protein
MSCLSLSRCRIARGFTHFLPGKERKGSYLMGVLPKQFEFGSELIR